MAQCPSLEMKEWFVFDENLQTRNKKNSTTTTTTESTVENDDLYNVCDLHSTFCSTLGGLRPQVDEIVRRVLDGRVLRQPGITTAMTSSSIDDSSSSSADAAAVAASLDEIRRQEMQGLLELGLHPIKG